MIGEEALRNSVFILAEENEAKAFVDEVGNRSMYVKGGIFCLH